MQLSYDDLLDIMSEASHRLHSEIRRSFKSGNLELYLGKIDMLDLLPAENEQSIYETDPHGKIIVFGDSHLKATELLGTGKSFGLSKDRFELHLSYEESKTYPFQKLRYNPNYRLILFGPVPHSGEGKEDASSIITNLQQKDGYPKVLCLSDSHKLKITKTSFARAIKKEIDEGYLAVSKAVMY